VPARLRLALLVATALAVAAVAAVAVLDDGGSSSRSGAGANAFAGALRPVIPPKDFKLRDQDGHVASLAAERGRIVVLTFMYSTCRDTCPVTASQIRGALDDLGHDVPVFAVSVDPANDTPERARAFLLRQHLTGRMRFLLGSRSQLAPVWRDYGIRPQRRGFEHSAYVLVIDRRGRQRIGFPIDKLTPEGLAHDLRRLRA
jgi:protein SCO1